MTDIKKVIDTNLFHHHFKDRRSKDVIICYLTEEHLEKVKEMYDMVENVFLTKFASAEDMLEVSDLVVTHGGRGTVYDSLEKGIPLIVIPHQAEQEWNADRIVKLGLGLKVSKVGYSMERLFEQLENILSEGDVDYKQEAERFSCLFNNYNWQQVVKDSVEQINLKKSLIKISSLLSHRN